MNCSDLEYFPKHSVCSGKTFEILLKLVNANLTIKLENRFARS